MGWGLSGWNKIQEPGGDLSGMEKTGGDLSRVEKIRGIVCGGKNMVVELSRSAKMTDGNCSRVKMSWLAKMTGGEMSGREIVWVG